MINELNLSRNKIDSEGLDHLSKGNLINLKYLDLSRNKIESVGNNMNSNFRLVNLNLSRNSIENGFVNLFIEKSDLKFVDLSYNFINDFTFDLISGCDFTNIVDLNVSNNLIGDCALEALSKCKFPTLNVLNLSTNKFSGKGIKHLVSGCFNKLNILDLSDNKIIDEDSVIQLSCGNFAKLTDLNLSHCSIPGNYMKHLSTGYLYNLKKLNLSYNEINNKGLKYLCEGNLKEMEELLLGNNLIRGYDGGLENLTGEVFNRLRVLDLSVNPVGESIRELIHNRLSRRLHLKLFFNRIKEETKKILSNYFYVLG
jgi:Leucine-rich repeat (LRR) protein